MRKTIVLLFILGGFYSAHSQDLIKEIKALNSKIVSDSLQKNVIEPLLDSIAFLNNTYVTELSKMQIQTKALEKDTTDLNKKIKDFEKIIGELNKNTVKKERDSLQKQVAALDATIAALNLKIIQSEGQIVEEKRMAEVRAKKEKENGRRELLDPLTNSYIKSSFDSLINSITQETIKRDIQLIGNNDTVKIIMSDLNTYFKGHAMLSNQFDAAQLEKLDSQLTKIKRPSNLLVKLKNNIKNYKMYNDELKKTIKYIIDLDERTLAGGVPKLEKKKLDEVLPELLTYMYDYYGYSNYPYLSNIVLEILKRKKMSADEPLIDLLGRL